MSDLPGVLMLDLQGLELTDEERQLLMQPHVGGVILFARNVRDVAQVQALVSDIRRCRPQILLAVDQEGGRVQRLREGFTRLPAMLRFGELWQQDQSAARALARDCGWLMAAEVLACGLDFSFAPVLDLHTGVSDVIGDRAFAADQEALITLATEFMQGMHEAGMATTGKHFPGHGSVSADSHHALPVDTRTVQSIREQDMQPFVRCMPVMDAVMPAHVIYEQADAACAGFSRYWLQTVLRQELGFDGVIFSDDLVMAAAAAAGNMEDRVKKALAAGCDMLLVCNDRSAALQALAVLETMDIEPNARLLRMQRKHHLTFDALIATPRWQQTRKQLAQLDPAT
ncbi:beta-N-acetylhexosaminidase [Pseudohongiella sp.]|uniref:beta-N-acetylhexosaminidase n=1 Tax=marine sediment metagenome TaxID=412755 RepID=A0A0F9Z3P4_9ZZZZ|nr:beta-N-acetylhexosaminidase [Pseudohongiella sp.]